MANLSRSKSALMWVTCCVCAMAWLGPVSLANAETGYGQVKVSATLSKSLYEPLETISVDFTLTNTSGSRVGLVAPNPCASGVLATVIRPNGYEEKIGDGGAPPLGPCELPVVAHRVLEPGAVLTVRFQWRTSFPGLYTMRFSALEGPKGTFEGLPIPPVDTSVTFRVGPFTDMAGHWAGDAVKNGAEKGVLLGYPDGTFRPDEPIKRGEFVKLLASLRGLHPEPAGEHWASGWLAAAVRAGYVAEPGLALDDPPTRLELVRMMVRAAGVQDATAETRAFPDVEPQDQAVVSAARAMGIVQGYPDGTFGPGRTATRAEALVTLLQLQDYLRAVPVEGATVLVGEKAVSARVLAGTALLPDLVEAGPVAAEVGITITPQADGSYILTRDSQFLVVIPGSAQAGNASLGRAVEEFEGRLYLPVSALTRLGIKVEVKR